MEQFMEIICVPAIAAIVYGIINLIKTAVNNNETFKRLIPVISAVSGAVLGCVAFYLAPSIIVADNIITALIVGGASGLTATGTNQIIKQLGKDKNE
jgi:FtsH-binding integral membrane protein